ncbi:MAG: WYL domain-containing protein [Verrucomicrobiota bacterium]
MAKAKRLGANRAALERMHRIHQLLQNGEHPNCTQLAAEFEVSRRTMKRDIEFMKDRMSLPIEFDVSHNGYRYTKPVSRFPELPMSEAEVFALFVAGKAIEQYRGTPFQRLLETAFRRLTGRLDENVKFSMGSLDSVISFRPFAPGDADVEAFEILSRGVRERRAVTFLYRNHGALAFQRRQVHPYHLAHVDGRWCLFAFDAVREAMRTFVLCRLKQPRLQARRFTVPKKFDLNEYLRHSFALFRGKDGDDYEVVLDLDAWAADEVRGRRWHESQELMELPGGMLRVSLRLNNIEEVEKWALGFSTHATVVRPKLLAERLRKTAVELAKRYADG